jgi:hypothetical protein
MNGVRPKITIGVGVLLLTTVSVAATWNITLFAAEFGLEATYEEWDCGTALNPKDVTGTSVIVGDDRQALCDEQILIYRVLAGIPLVLGLGAVAYGFRRRSADKPQKG